MGVIYKSPARDKKVLYTRKEIYGAMPGEDKVYNPGGCGLPEPLVAWASLPIDRAMAILLWTKR